jgi:hypothetical protein
MKRIALFALVIPVLAACGDVPTDTATQSGQLSAAETFSFHVRSACADAAFSMVDGVGAQTDVEIDVCTDSHPARDGKAGPPESRTHMSIGINIGINRFRSGQVILDASSFHFPAISRGARATLNATVNVHDISFPTSSFDVLIDVTWVCTGEVEREVSHHAFGTPGEDVDVQSYQVVRCAASATGVVSDDGTDFIGGPSESAEMRSENLVEVEVSTGR